MVVAFVFVFIFDFSFNFNVDFDSAFIFIYVFVFFLSVLSELRHGEEQHSHVQVKQPGALQGAFFS